MLDISKIAKVYSGKRAERADVGVAGPSPAHVRGLVEAAVEERTEGLRKVLASVERKLREQTALVADSMSKVESFMALYHSSRDELEARLAAGQRHQERLNKLLHDSAAAAEAEERAKAAASLGASSASRGSDRGGGSLRGSGGDGGGGGSGGGGGGGDERFSESRLSEPRLSEPRLSEPRFSEPHLAEQRPSEPFKLAFDEISEIVKEMSAERVAAGRSRGPQRSARGSKSKSGGSGGSGGSIAKKKKVSSGSSARGSDATPVRGRALDGSRDLSSRGGSSASRRSTSADPHPHERLTVSSANRRRSQTPPPPYAYYAQGGEGNVVALTNEHERERERDEHGPGSAWTGSRRASTSSDGGGTRGRGSEPEPAAAAAAPWASTEPLAATRPGAASSQGDRPAWNSGTATSLPVNPSATISMLRNMDKKGALETGYSSGDTDPSSLSASFAATQRRNRLKELYRELAGASPSK